MIDSRNLLTGFNTIFCMSVFCYAVFCSSEKAMAVDAPANVEIEEVIVTAEFRDSSLQSIAKSITVLDESVIKARGATHLEESLNLIPNLNFSSGTSRARFFQIRGIGERSQFVEPINPSVGILIDDIDFTGAGSIATLLDVEQVEVLKGPQGTRYGANSLAGLINIKTKDPTEEFEASIHTNMAEFESNTWGAVLSGPLSEEVGYRLAVEKSKSNGYMKNAYLQRENTNGRDELTIRTKLHWQVTDNWSLKTSLFNVDFDNGYDAFSLDNTRVTLSDRPGHDRQDSTGLSFANQWHLPTVSIEFISGFSDSDLEYGYDEDWSFVGIHPWEYSSFDNYSRERKTRSHEVRLVSNGSSRLFGDSTDWITGIYSLSSDEDLIRQYTYLVGDFNSQYNFDTLAIYAQLDTEVSESFLISSGVRVENRTADYSTSDLVDFSTDETFWGGRLTFQFLLKNQAMTYVSVAKGYKAGGFNTDGTLTAELRTFDSEDLLEFEWGIKATSLEDQLITRLAIFYDDRRDQQVKSSKPITRPDDSTEFVDLLDNAAEGTNRGLEFELEWNPAGRFGLYANLAWLEAKFDDYINVFGEDLSGREQAHAPNYMYSMGINYSLNNLSFQLSADGKDSFYFSDRHSTRSTSYTLLNANLSYETDSLTVILWGRNLTDKDYFVRGFGSFGNDPRKAYIIESYFQYGEPRVVGISVEYHFR